MFKAAAASRVAAFRMEFAGMAPAHSDAWVCHHRMLHSHFFQGPGECLLQEGSWGRVKIKESRLSLCHGVETAHVLA